MACTYLWLTPLHAILLIEIDPLWPFSAMVTTKSCLHIHLASYSMVVFIASSNVFPELLVHCLPTPSHCPSRVLQLSSVKVWTPTTGLLKGLLLCALQPSGATQALSSCFYAMGEWESWLGDIDCMPLHWARGEFITCVCVCACVCACMRALWSLSLQRSV